MFWRAATNKWMFKKPWLRWINFRRTLQCEAGLQSFLHGYDQRGYDSCCPSVCPSSFHLPRSCERDTSATPWWNFFRFSSNTHTNSKMNRFCLWEVKGHSRSESDLSRMLWRNFPHFGTCVGSDPWLNWLDCCGQRVKGQVYCDVYVKSTPNFYPPTARATLRLLFDPDCRLKGAELLE